MRSTAATQSWRKANMSLFLAGPIAMSLLTFVHETTFRLVLSCPVVKVTQSNYPGRANPVVV